ncbi:MAG: class I SAM-dependent methyltransferase family protein [Candidatus Aenigmarchaeota archaeon]|nr:class I SAM-dependent methyltransferase family protein [Candidatus Aenigmarchaeota archaeon]
MLAKTKELILKNLEIPKNLKDKVPKGYQRIGDIILIRIPEELEEWKFEIGEILLRNLSSVKTVCNIKKIFGIKRRPKIEVLAGDGTETIFWENNCLFKIDVSKLMFSKGNTYERQRLIKLVKDGEVIVDMFAGIGYFTIPIAKFANPKKIYSIEINPLAFNYLKENIRINKISHKVIAFYGDCRKISERLKNVADRVIMGYIRTRGFLPYAFKFLKEDGGYLHYHDIFKKEEIFDLPMKIVKKEAKKNGYEVEFLTKRKVKSYAPKVYHVVLDVRVIKKKS